MPPKITLITPPDIFQNNQDSIMLIDLTDAEQDEVSKWLGTTSGTNINLYFYQGEENVPWFLHSLAVATHKYINLDNASKVSSYLMGYILSKHGVFYSTRDINISELFSHININRVSNAKVFLERVFSGKE